MSENQEDLIAEAITEQFGERCPDFDANCHCCKVWQQYHALKADADEIKKQIHRATNAEYMLSAYRNMLGENGLAVAKEWEARGVRRVHFDWGPEAHKLTGEERAQFILNMNNAIPAHPDTLTDEAKLRRSAAAPINDGEK